MTGPSASLAQYGGALVAWQARSIDRTSHTQSMRLTTVHDIHATYRRSFTEACKTSVGLGLRMEYEDGTWERGSWQTVCRMSQ